MKQFNKKWAAYVTNPALVFVSLATIAGIMSAFLVPQLLVSDENMHFLRAYNLASGKLGNTDCSYPTDINAKAGSIYQGDFRADYVKKVDFSQTINASCGTAAGYSPLMHLPQAIGIFLGKLIYPSTALLVLLGRLANLVFYIVAVYFIIKQVKFGKWAFVVIGLFPSMIHLAASLSSDVVNNVVVLGIVAIIFNLFSQKSRISNKQIIFFMILSCLLALTKLTNVLLLLPLLFLPVRLFKKNTLNAPFNIQKWMFVLLSGIVSIASIFVWQKVYGASLIAASPPNPLIDRPFHFFKILFNTYINPFIGYSDELLRGTVGDFTSFSYHLPTVIILLELLLLFIVLFHKDKDEEKALGPKSKWLIWSCLGALCLLVVLVSYALYTTWAILPFVLGAGAQYADGVQGRYFIATLTLLIPLCIWLRRFISINTKSKLTLGVLVFSISAFSLLFYLFETYLFYK